MVSRRSLFVLGAALFLIAGVMGNFDATLRQMHVPGGVSGGVTTIASPLTSRASAESLQQSWRAWDDYVGNLPDGSNVAGYDRVRTRPGTIVAIWLVLDSLFFAPLVWLLLIGAGARRARVRGTWEHWLDAMWLIATVYLAADEIENILTALHIFHHWPPFVFVRIASGVKVAFLVTAALPIVLSLLRPGAAEPDDVEPLRHLARRYRVPLAMTAGVGAILLFLPSSVRPQIADVVRTWTPGDHLDGLWWTAGLLAVFIVCVWCAGVIAADRARASAAPRTVDTRYIVTNALGILAVVTVTLIVKLAGVDVGFPLGFVVAAAWAFNLGGVTAIPAGPGQPRPGENADSRRTLACITALPALFLAALVLRSAELVQRNEATAIALLVAAAGFAVFVALLILLPRVETPVRDAIVALAVIGAGALLVAVWVLASLVEHSWVIGTVGLLVLTMIVLTVLFGLLGLLRRPPNGALALLRIRRPPILIGVVAVYLLTGAFNQTIGFHKVRTLGPGVDAQTLDQRHRVDLSRAISTVAAADVPAVTTPGKPVTPLFVVVTSGGGGRAAYWTLLAANCLFSGQKPPGVTTAMPECSRAAPWDHVFAASGISGGSVGLAMYAAQQAGAAPGPVPVDDVFGDGFVDPDVASMLLVDLPNGLLTHDAWPDRAAALEEAWEKKLPAMQQGFYATQLAKDAKGAAVPRLPALMLNGTAVEDGCRLNVSVLDLVAEGPAGARPTTCRALEQFGKPATATAPDRPLSATRDVDDYVCGDIRLSTAGLLSARFPYVSPTGALTACAHGNAKAGSHTFAVDGGYVDSSGASPIVQLLDSTVTRLQADLGSSTCVQPVVLQIDNSYEDLTRPVDPTRPSELFAPVVGLGAASGAAADNARQALAVEATRRRCDVGGRRTYLHLYPRARPGIEAPLGWSLSKVARDDMKDQLASAENRAVLCDVDRWLAATSTPCAPGPPPPAALAATPRLAQVPWLWLLLTLIAIAVAARAAWMLRGTNRGRAFAGD